jgi:hypothetical protein
MLAETIKQHALADAQAGNWPEVAAALQAISVTAEPRLCYAVESGTAVAQAGGDPTTLLTVLLGDPNGMMLFQKLSSSAGVMWSHPATVPYLQALVNAGAMSEAVKAALIDLSAPVTHPFADVTANQCALVWAADLAQIARSDRRALYDAFDNAVGTSEQVDKIAEMRAMLNSVEAS